ncbi:MAG: Long-chain acyl-(acyl-carrier-protein) reductase [Candidatus Omnitrophica bacterium ADurb.Bin277]|nr:MAG: Long-chain acyl-(acyl-carrier-protein) reductase [Candidatus Omnitrophica bacterium ADurb.Bin277]
MSHLGEPFCVQVSRILSVQPGDILRLMGQTEIFLKDLPFVKECRLISREGYRSVTFWRVEIDHVPISWKEESIFDLRNGTVSFRALEGDLRVLEGVWKLTECPQGGTEVWIEAKVEIGIPAVFEKAVGGMIVEKIRKFFETVLDSMEERIGFERYRRKNEKSSRISGFGVIGHPYNYQHFLKNLHLLKLDFKAPSPEFLTKVFDLTPSYISYGVQEFRDSAGKTTRGAFIACNIIPEMLTVDIRKTVAKVVESCKVAERHGFGIVALGGFTSIAGEKYGEEFLKQIHIPVTTGNTLTAALAVEGVLKAARLMETDISKAKVAVIGGAGDIGSACARVMAFSAKEVTIVSRSPANLRKMEKEIKSIRHAKFHGTSDAVKAVRDADIVIGAASSPHSLLELRHFKNGAIVCDVGFPKNIVYGDVDRGDILVFAGGICSIPCEFQTGLEIGLPSTRMLYGCFSEAIVLALEERYENFSWGKGHITREKMDEILELAQKHGFSLAPFFWSGGIITDDEVRAIGTGLRAGV